MNTTIKTILEYQADRIEGVLQQHEIAARVTGGTVTPRWVRFQVLPAVGTRISMIHALSGELAVALDVSAVHVARQGAAVQIEIPRDDAQPVRLLPLLRGLQDTPPYTAVLGLEEGGAPLLLRLPSPDAAHVLVTGVTASGKTTLLRSMIVSLALRHCPNDPPLSLVLIGRAFDDLGGLPHLARPVVQPENAPEALRSATRLVEERSRRGVMLPLVVVVIDELLELDGAGPLLAYLVERGRAAGVHLVAATQKPGAAAVCGLADGFPVRIAGQAASAQEARAATGWPGSGAERLLGRGDFVVMAEGQAFRFQAAYVSPDEVAEVVRVMGHQPGLSLVQGVGRFAAPAPAL